MICGYNRFVGSPYYGNLLMFLKSNPGYARRVPGGNCSTGV